MTIYTNIAKPVGSTYTNQNTIGKEQYDQSTLQYDNAFTFYDGVNESMYTNIAKPISTSITWNQALFNWASANFPWTGSGSYTKVPKPS